MQVKEFRAVLYELLVNSFGATIGVSLRLQIEHELLRHVVAHGLISAALAHHGSREAVLNQEADEFGQF